MLAAYIEELGAPDVIRHGELPTPRPGPTDVLVNVEVTAVNHVDTFVRSGAWRTPVQFPFVIGRDLVGTVAAASPGAPGFAVGDRVWCNSLGHAGRQGAAAEQVVVPADRLYHLPEGVSPADAVAVAHPAATAYLALFTHGRLRAGETVVVIGGGGNVGSALIVMASRAGARVVTTASARDAEYCRALGAAEVIDYRDPDVMKCLREACPRGADLYIDTSARNDLESAVELLARRGRVVVLAGLRTRPVLPAGPLYLKDCSVVGFAISQATVTELADAAATINRLLADGALRPPAVETLPLSAAAEAHRRLEAGEVRGKMVLRVTGAEA
ncbi:MAG TPA: NADPH:quinone reductase [Streptomyces sp.]|uniref:NADPH:quinone reductase n=1 Tax=Streptomyces sp. TaxID=1931 RepID=UPI002D692D4E|nr:NADPH:quinone reductase [Streptomyces sp.]HZG03051.1 NADPH:quinone reductase [Streptomyces sp.]